MKVGYVRVSKNDGSQSTSMQRDALIEYGVLDENIYEDLASGAKDDRPGLEACLKALRADDELVLYRIDRLGRKTHSMITLLHSLAQRSVSIRVLNGYGEIFSSSGPAAQLVTTVMLAVISYERDVLIERTKHGLQAARARGRIGGRKFAMTPSMLRRAQHGMASRDTNVGNLCDELRISRQTLYRLVGPTGELRPDGERLLAKAGK